jgi:alkylation response protein AidB-like acyl-CoA dehydrogenase
MKFMDLEVETLDAMLPGVREALQEHPLSVLESRESPGIGIFKQSPGPGLLVQREFGGLGATPLEAVRVQRAIGMLSPSLAVGTTMHHFSMASIVQLGEASTGFEWLLLEAVATDRLIVASGFAEGRAGTSIFDPTVSATRVDRGYRISGTKRPCSLSRSMDLLTTSIAVEPEPGAEQVMAVALIPADAEGMRVEPFWNSWALAGAESDAVVMTDVEVEDELVAVSSVGFGKELDLMSQYALQWFSLLISASYLGAVSRLVQMVLEYERPLESEKARLTIEVEGASMILEGLARSMMAGEQEGSGLTRALTGRFAIQQALQRTTALATELLGGVAFVSAPDVACVAASVHALALHPPHRIAATPTIVAHAEGKNAHVL